MRRNEFLEKIRHASDLELESMLVQERANLFKIRQQLALKQLENPHAASNSRKNIARILGEMRARQLRAGKGA